MKKTATFLGVLFTTSLLGLLASCSSSKDEPPPVPAGPGGTGANDAGYGGACKDDSTCAGGKCVSGGCFSVTAANGTKDGTETDIDCGGQAAPGCAEGKACGSGVDCASTICNAGVCTAPSPTDGLKNGDESDVDCGGKLAPKCKSAQSCKFPEDCESLVCSPEGKCSDPGPADGVKNGTETDVDCGGGAAPLCAEGKACVAGPDCDSRFCTNNVCEPRMAGRQDGDETDVDCGGTIAAKCDWDKGCAADTDCTSGACGDNKKCLTGPSCKVLHGGSTCGTGEFNEAGKSHESCCRSLPVAGFSDPQNAGKTVYLDKYEITAGRMRAFLDAVTAAQGVPNVKAYMATHRPARWVNGWENTLPQSLYNDNAGAAPFTVSSPTADPLYPGQDVNLAVRTQTTWNVVSGNYTVYPGVAQSLGEYHFFPEYTAPAPPWPSADYAASHNLNCSNENGSYGYGTYWQPVATLKAVSANPNNVGGKKFTQAEMDEKALNCTPFGLYAAFCAWDGGQLATEEVLNTVMNGRVPASANCNGINAGPDGTSACGNVYYYPFEPQGSTSDGSSRIAPPGRVAADVVRINANDEPWMDLQGNLVEVMLKSNNLFDYKGLGIGYDSIKHHKAQMRTPRGKAGSFGARCMRFK